MAYLRVRSGFLVRDALLLTSSAFFPRKKRRKSIFKESKMLARLDVEKLQALGALTLTMTERTATPVCQQ